MGKRALLVAVVLASGSITASTFADLITFDELPVGTIVDGMVIGNVTFGFTSLDSTINGGPGTTMFIDQPNIEGDIFGTLTLDFAQPVLDVSYGFAVSTLLPETGSSTMELFSPGGASLGSFSADAMDFGFGFLENENSADGVGLIGSAEVTFESSAAPRFAFDNLEFTIPSPAALGLFAVAGFMSAGRRRR